MCAQSGREALQYKLADERQKEEEAQNEIDIAERLAALQKETQMAHSQRDTSHVGASQHLMASPSSPTLTTSNPLNHQAPSSRNLVDPSRFRLVDSRGLASGAANGAASRTVNTGSVGATPRALPTPNHTGMPPNEYSGPRAYTEVAKEKIGLDFVRRVFASDEQKMRDLRAQYGVGADAVDELDRFFELKVYAGAEPDRIVLEDSQIRLAMSTPNFFLVVVSELEGEHALPKVRVIIDPLSQLSMAESSSVTFTGVHSSHSVVYQFEKED
jgi:hypothetical protein